VSIINYLRWACIIPLAISGFYIAMISGFVSFYLLNSLCPTARISESCSAPYMQMASDIIFVIFPGFAAILVVLLPTLMAPNKKAIIAVTAFTIGSLVAIFFAINTKAWTTLCFTLLCGAISVYCVFYKLREKHGSANSL